ncbi:hypothetical protein D1007_29718 [Hordeum vulgare]|nr:hypothetical protein D1007_29718 [Hordeum vulgare]
MDARAGTPLTPLSRHRWCSAEHRPRAQPLLAAADDHGDRWRRAGAAPSKLPNAVRPKKGKTSEKKNKAADGSGSSKARGKKLAGV